MKPSEKVQAESFWVSRTARAAMIEGPGDAGGQSVQFAGSLCGGSSSRKARLQFTQPGASWQCWGHRARTASCCWYAGEWPQLFGAMLPEVCASLLAPCSAAW